MSTLKAKCPECNGALRIKPGTKRTTPKPLFQCCHCIRRGLPADECEFSPAMVRMLGECRQAEDSIDDIRTPSTTEDR